MSNENPNALKHMYGQAFMKRMSDALKEASREFNTRSFLALTPQLLKLEMKPRVHLVRDELHRQLPQSFPEALKILMSSIKSGGLSGFDLWPYTEFIQAYGLKHAKLSLDAQKEITKLFTAEFSVRPFLRVDPSGTLSYLMKCAQDKNESVRRWASEGSRPRLPWGEKLHHFIAHPELTLPILNQLCFDEALYVRKSVANHLNDIAKDHPALVIKTLKQWKKKANKEQMVYLEWIMNHSLRTLIKQGHPDAMELLGVNVGAEVELSSFKLQQKNLKINDRLVFGFTVKSLDKKASKVVVDYKIHFFKSGGKHSAKVFKLKNIELAPGEEIRIEKNHHVKAVTTRTHFSGIHYLEIMINGKSFKKVSWNLA